MAYIKLEDLQKFPIRIDHYDKEQCKTLGSPDWKRCPICEAKMDGGKQ